MEGALECVIRAFFGGLNAHITYFGLQIKNKTKEIFFDQPKPSKIYFC